MLDSDVIEEAVLSDIEHETLPNQLLQSEQDTPTNEQAPPTQEVMTSEDSQTCEESGDAEKKTEETAEEEPAQQSVIVNDRRGKLPIWKVKMMEQQAAAKVNFQYCDGSHQISVSIIGAPCTRYCLQR